jgi:hypothetical protein
MQGTNAQFEIVVEGLRPWAHRVERRTRVTLRYAAWGRAVTVVAIAVATAVASWQVWAAMPSPRLR